MSRPFRLRRSELSTPGTSEKMMAKAATSAADLVFLDLEDAVRPDLKIRRGDPIDRLEIRDVEPPLRCVPEIVILSISHHADDLQWNLAGLDMFADRTGAGGDQPRHCRRARGRAIGKLGAAGGGRQPGEVDVVLYRKRHAPERPPSSALAFEGACRGEAIRHPKGG